MQRLPNTCICQYNILLYLPIELPIQHPNFRLILTKHWSILHHFDAMHISYNGRTPFSWKFKVIRLSRFVRLRSCIDCCVLATWTYANSFLQLSSPVLGGGGVSIFGRAKRGGTKSTRREFILLLPTLSGTQTTNRRLIKLVQAITTTSLTTKHFVAHHWAGPWCGGKRGGLKSTGLKQEWALERTSWRSLIGGNRPTCALAWKADDKRWWCNYNNWDIHQQLIKNRHI